MFLERYYGLLRPGGKLITVIDDTLLASKDFAYVRDYIRDRFLVRAISLCRAIRSGVPVLG